MHLREISEQEGYCWLHLEDAIVHHHGSANIVLIALTDDVQMERDVLTIGFLVMVIYHEGLIFQLFDGIIAIDTKAAKG